MDIVTIVIQIIAGAIGGNVGGALLKQYSMGTTGNSIAGAVGGVIVGQVLKSLQGAAPVATDAAAGAVASGMDIGAIVTQIAGGGIGGAVVMVVIGIIRNMMNKKSA